MVVTSNKRPKLSGETLSWIDDISERYQISKEEVEELYRGSPKKGATYRRRMVEDILKRRFV